MLQILTHQILTHIHFAFRHLLGSQYVLLKALRG